MEHCAATYYLVTLVAVDAFTWAITILDRFGECVPKSIRVLFLSGRNDVVNYFELFNNGWLARTEIVW
jgi:hypothetical protein